MKRSFVYIVSVIVLFATMVSFAACGKKDDTTPTKATVEKVEQSTTTTTIPSSVDENGVVYKYVIVTDKNGEAATNENGEVKTKLAKQTTTAPIESGAGAGGTDPYVVDPF